MEYTKIRLIMAYARLIVEVMQNSWILYIYSEDRAKGIS